MSKKKDKMRKYKPEDSVSLVRDIVDGGYRHETSRNRGLLSSLGECWGNANERRAIESKTMLKAARIDDKMLEVQAAVELDNHQHTMWMRREQRAQSREQTIALKQSNKLARIKTKIEKENLRLIRSEADQRKLLAAKSEESDV